LKETSVPKLTKTIGSILILLGLVSYFGTGMESVTALIPSFFGLVFVGLGIFAGRNEGMRKHAMHAALLLALIGLAGSFGGLTQLLGSLGGGAIDRPAAATSQSLMAILCIYFIIMGVKSFIDARKQGEPASEEESEETPED
ncbi:MAG: hypothetical protein WD599_02750, partial [Balneolaceae bacterium]